MDNIIDLIATDASSSQISDAIKSSLYAKAAEKIDSARPFVAGSLFGVEDSTEEQQEESQED